MATIQIDLGLLKKALYALRKFAVGGALLRVVAAADKNTLEFFTHGPSATVGVQITNVPVDRDGDVVVKGEALVADIVRLWKMAGDIARKGGGKFGMAERLFELHITQRELTVRGMGKILEQKGLVDVPEVDMPPVVTLRALTWRAYCVEKCDHPTVHPMVLNGARMAATTLGYDLDIWTAAVEGGGYVIYGEADEIDPALPTVRLGALLRPAIPRVKASKAKAVRPPAARKAVEKPAKGGSKAPAAPAEKPAKGKGKGGSKAPAEAAEKPAKGKGKGGSKAPAEAAEPKKELSEDQVVNLATNVAVQLAQRLEAAKAAAAA